VRGSDRLSREGVSDGLNFLAALAAEDADGRRSKRNLRRFLAGNAAMRKEEQLAAGSLFYVPDKTEV
jgi:hypothetical protein